MVKLIFRNTLANKKDKYSRQSFIGFDQREGTYIEGRVKKSGEYGEHAPTTPEAFPRNTSDKKVFESCFK